jgi:UDP:flavonoid glycosyltransferase YjiC (YdhE family)
VGVVLFSAELGSGFGHIKRLLPIAEAAAAAGHRPLFLVGNPEEASALLGPAGFEARPAPSARWAARARSQGVATSYGDIIGSAGFGDRELLREITTAWDAVLAELRPTAAVAELSPFLNLATYGGELPVLVVGHGFALPPPHLPAFPRLWDGPPLYDEATLLENAAVACRARGRPAPAALPALLAGHAHAVTGLETLDPYRDQRRQPAVGPPALEATLAGGAGEADVFAYLLGDEPTTLGILRVLAASGARGRVFVRRGTGAHVHALAGGGMVYVPEPVPIREALEGARVILHHGSMLTSEEALAAGRPQVVAPLYLEHLFTARALDALGVARVVRPSFSDAEIAGLLASALADGDLAGRAREVARRFWREWAPPADLPRRLFGAVVAS